MINLNESNVCMAIVVGEGSLTAAAEVLRVRRDELMEFLVSRPDLQDFAVNVREEAMDDCQISLGDAISQGSPWAIKYTLRSLGAGRGYGIAGAGNREPEIANEPISQLRIPDSLLPIRDALEQAMGHVTRAAQALGTTRAEVKKAIADCPSLQMVLFHARESLIDYAETALRSAAHDKKPWAIMFTLSTLGRDRGYGRPAKRAPGARGKKASIPEPAQPKSSRNIDPAPELQPANTGPSGLPASGDVLPVYVPVNGNGTLDGRSKEERVRDVVSEIAAQLSGKQAPMATAGNADVTRNAPCPCNSGRKFKRCCGA
jgi:SEC-C motif